MEESKKKRKEKYVSVDMLAKEFKYVYNVALAAVGFFFLFEQE